MILELGGIYGRKGDQIRSQDMTNMDTERNEEKRDDNWMKEASQEWLDKPQHKEFVRAPKKRGRRKGGRNVITGR